jgi:hypothetical protein
MSVIEDICNELDNMSDDEFEAKWKVVCDEVGDADSPTVEEYIDFLKGYKEQKEALDLIDKARENLMNMTEEEREELFKKCEEWNNVGPDAEEFIDILLKDQKDIDPDIRNHVDEYFWELV